MVGGEHGCPLPSRQCFNLSLSLSLSVEEDGLQRENKRLERVIDKMRCVC